MKLSEAIRLGAMLRPQEFDTVFDPRTGGSCALGAAAEAIGALDTTKYNCFVPGARSKIPATWKWAKGPCECPMCDVAWVPASRHAHDAQGVIVHLNNYHRWTREQIAEWVEGVEAAQAHVEPASTNAVREETEQPGVPLRV